MSNGPAVTIHEVARRAGVSTATVSRALSGARPVAPHIVERVRAAADELGYRVNSVGRSLRRRTTETVALVVADITNPFFPSLVKTVEDALGERGFGLLLADAGNDVEREREAVERLLERQVDALVLTPVSRVRSRPAVVDAAARTRVVQLDRRASSQADYVGMDNARAVTDVLAHLGALGRRRPVFVGSDPEISTTWERQRAFDRLARWPRRAAPTLVGSFSLDWGRDAARQVLARWSDADALVCADDLIAVGALEELAAAGVSVPDDVAVVGFDDTLLGVLHAPQVTTVRQPIEEMAHLVVAAAVDGVSVGRRTVRGTLVVRGSTAGCITGR